MAQDLPRLHVDHPLEADAVLVLSAAHAHYLGNVLRRGPGDGVRLFNAADGEWLADIEALRRDRGSVRLTQRLRLPAPEPGPALLFAPLKRDATDLVVRMATELGVSALCPVLTERTNTARINAERWHAIAVEAAEQSERLTLPEITPTQLLPALLGAWPPARPLLAAIERLSGGTGIAAWRSHAPPDAQPGLLIGPEGGFTPSELDLLRARAFICPVSLGSRILRAETAALAGLAALQV